MYSKNQEVAKGSFPDDGSQMICTLPCVSQLYYCGYPHQFWTLGASDHQYTFVQISRMCLVLFSVPHPPKKTQGLIHLLLSMVLKIKF